MATEFYQSIQAVNAESQTALARGDAAGMVAVYTQDAQLLPPNRDILNGSAALQTFWQGVIDMGIRAMTLEAVELERHGEIAYEVWTGRDMLETKGAKATSLLREIEAMAAEFPSL
jgi:ketosteroid isomerase-like protein